MSDYEVQERPGQLEFYSKSAAAQFKLLKPTYNEKGFVARNGCILVEATKAIPGKEKEYDWSSKISFAIMINDICTLFADLDNPKALVHDQNGTIKKLEFQPSTDPKYAGSVMMKFSQKEEGGESRFFSVPLQAGQWLVLQRLLIGSVPKFLGWD